MCYHVSTPEKIKFGEFAKKNERELNFNEISYYHVSGFNRPYLPATLSTSQKTIAAARWKLLGSRIRTEEEADKSQYNTLNARSEYIFTSSTYKPFILKNKGLLYIDGFYEPHTVKGVKETENYYIYHPAHEIFTLGIVFAPFTDQETGNHYNTFSVITVPANPLLAEIHNKAKRMPLIIPDEGQNDWLNTITKEGTESFFQPYTGELEAHRSARVTGMRGVDTNLPEIQNPI